MPREEGELSLFSSYDRIHLSSLITSAIAQAETSIYMETYGFSDDWILSSLQTAAKKNIAIEVVTDSRALTHPSPFSFCVHQVSPKKGLMHRKSCIIDSSLVLVGSANFTKTSLGCHQNIMVAIRSSKLAEQLQNKKPLVTSLSLGKNHLTTYLLPDTGEEALEALCKEITSAKKSIQLALFTITHKKISHAIKLATERGVKVTLVTDLYAAKGANKKFLKELEHLPIQIHVNYGPELLHHKWAWIDEKTFIFGSANWTCSAFKNNSDFLFILKCCEKHLQRKINMIWMQVFSNSTPLIQP